MSNQKELPSFTPDAPAEEDTLGRRPLARQIAQRIHDYDGHEPIVFGILGPWGSGKTTLRNMVVDEFESMRRHPPPKSIRDSDHIILDLLTRILWPWNRKSETDYSGWIVYEFNPWLVSNAESLVQEFLDGLASRVDIEPRDKRMSDLVQLIRAFSAALAATEPLTGTSAGPLRNLVSSFTTSSHPRPRPSQSPDLAGLKDRIDDSIRQSEYRLLILLDDIDRLTDSEIKEVLRLIRSVADFRDTIFVVCCDPEVIADALDEHSDRKNRAYLQKIIDVPFWLPKIPPWKLKELFLTEVLPIEPENHQLDEPIRAENRFDALWDEIISKYVTDIRDIKRLQNVVHHRHSLIAGEVDPFDFAALETIREFDHDLYEYIAQHPVLTRNEEDWTDSNTDDSSNNNQIERKADDIIDSLDESGLEIIRFLFPNHLPPSNSPEFFLHKTRDKGVDDPEYYDRYFAFDTPPNTISEAKYSEFLTGARENNSFPSHSEDLKTWIDNNPKAIQSFIDRLEMSLENDEGAFPYLGMAALIFVACNTDPLTLPRNQFSNLIRAWMTLIALELENTPSDSERELPRFLAPWIHKPTLSSIRSLMCVIENRNYPLLTSKTSDLHSLNIVFDENVTSCILHNLPVALSVALKSKAAKSDDFEKLRITINGACDLCGAKYIGDALLEPPPSLLRDLSRMWCFTHYRLKKRGGHRRNNELSYQDAFQNLSTQKQNALRESLRRLRDGDYPDPNDEISRQADALLP